MLYKRIIIGAILLSGCSRSHSQALQVMATGGGYYTSAGNSLSMTIGEMILVQTYSGPGAILTGGFQQAEGTVALPVTLLSFTARLENRQTLLQWETAQEFQNDHFDLERSGDGVSFVKFGQVKGAGNSNVVTDYHAVDPEPFPGNTYYRLKQVDQDGHFTYSGVVMVFLDAAINWSVYPNPARDRLFVRFFSDRDELLVLSLFDPSGKLLQQKEQWIMRGSNQLEMDMASFSAGLYFVRMAAGDAVIPPVPVVKTSH